MFYEGILGSIIRDRNTLYPLKNPTPLGVGVSAEIQTSANMVVEKHTYSAYTDELENFLSAQPANAIIEICGIDSDACVLDTAFSLFDAGYSIEIKDDLIEISGGTAYDDASKQIIERNLCLTVKKDSGN